MTNDSLYQSNKVRSFSSTNETKKDGFIEPLGRVSFGTIFKGIFAQRAIAVKRLEKVMVDGEVKVPK